MMKSVFKRLIRWACKEELDEMHEETDKLIRSGKEIAQYERET